jgi:hypothetical protein
MIQNIKIFIGIISLIFLLEGCASSREIIDEDVKLERKKTNDLVFFLDSISEKKPSFLYSKIGTEYSDTNQNLRFKTSLRMVKDSAINLLFTYAKFPVANAIISTDSLTIVNKRAKCFIQQDLSYIKESFGVDFVYPNLEEVFLGLPLDFDTEQKYFQIHQPNYYVISSHRKNKMKRGEKKDKEDLFIKYFIDKDITSLSGMYISSPSDSTEIFIEYKSRELVGEYLLPKEVNINVITPRNNIKIALDYYKAEVNEPQPLILVIPSDYEQCQ